jgi:hypothetical protein
VTILAGDRDFMAGNRSIQGVISIEGPVLSALQGEEPGQFTLSRQEAGWVRYIGGNITAALAKLRPMKIAGMESGKLSATPVAPLAPILYLVSDWVTNPKYRESRYGTILEYFRTGQAPALLAAVPGASPLDYSDLPVKHPLLKFLIRGEEKALWTGKEYPENTAGLIANFASLLTKDRWSVKRTVLSRDIAIETNRAWNLGNAGYILGL